MATYTVKFSGRSEVEASSEEEAIDKFNNCDFDSLDYDDIECGGIIQLYSKKIPA